MSIITLDIKYLHPSTINVYYPGGGVMRQLIPLPRALKADKRLGLEHPIPIIRLYSMTSEVDSMITRHSKQRSSVFNQEAATEAVVEADDAVLNSSERIILGRIYGHEGCARDPRCQSCKSKECINLPKHVASASRGCLFS